jgi:hypothetical protein
MPIQKRLSPFQLLMPKESLTSLPFLLTDESCTALLLKPEMVIVVATGKIITRIANLNANRKPLRLSLYRSSQGKSTSQQTNRHHLCNHRFYIHHFHDQPPDYTIMNTHSLAAVARNLFIKSVSRDC